jgi:hypothetical protein
VIASHNCLHCYQRIRYKIHQQDIEIHIHTCELRPTCIGRAYGDIGQYSHGYRSFEITVVVVTVSSRWCITNGLLFICFPLIEMILRFCLFQV